ncbi:MAG TPA: DUF4040 domain-containing protein [bacterium (Candidatus Stahlbacteria)]|nr:DUF4040 domain-containing protein [Candidatus Stahlbacteria bacterium]
MFILMVILLFMLITAIIAIEIKNLLAAIISLGAVGMAVAIGFVLLMAPDLAIVQIVVEVLTLVFMVAVIFKTTYDDETIKNPILPLPILSYALFVVAFLTFGVRALSELPRFGEPILRVASNYINLGISGTGAANLVAAVILDYRALDTLGEATVLLTAVVGVLVVMRKTGRER